MGGEELAAIIKHERRFSFESIWLAFTRFVCGVCARFEGKYPTDASGLIPRSCTLGVASAAEDSNGWL